MKRLPFPLLAIVFLMFMTACGDENGSGSASGGDATTNAGNGNAQPGDENGKPREATKGAIYDLSEKGIPVTVPGPTGANIKQGLMTGQLGGKTIYDWDIEKDNFRLNVNMIDGDVEEGQTAESIFQDWVKAMKSEKGFKMIQEDPSGCIFKTENGLGCYHVLVKDNREIAFSEGQFSREFNEADIREIYNSATAAK